MTLPELGQWVRWLTPEFGREGRVIQVQYPSLVIRWLGVDEPQVFPDATPYFENGYRGMELITKPKQADQVAQRRVGQVLDISTAAVMLGSTPKRVRQLLRAGRLRGVQKGGRWVEVMLDDAGD